MSSEDRIEATKLRFENFVTMSAEIRRLRAALEEIERCYGPLSLARSLARKALNHE